MGKKSKQKDHRKDRHKGTEHAAPWAAEATPTAGPGQVQPASEATGRRAAAEGAPADTDAELGASPGPIIDAVELAARLAGLSAVLQRQLARVDAGDGLTRARLSALALLVLGGPRTLGELAAAERVRPPTMTRLVQAMEADGLVMRERNPADGRSVVVRASARGERQLGQGRARQIAPLAESIAELDRFERLQLEGASNLLGRVLREASWEPVVAVE